jgi:hypothetical protein
MILSRHDLRIERTRYGLALWFGDALTTYAAWSATQDEGDYKPPPEPSLVLARSAQEALVFAALAGPAGPTGPTGAMGVQGPAGPP